jgi:glycerol-1-phosphate dehydrogenase [NAD(P)+]
MLLPKLAWAETTSFGSFFLEDWMVEMNLGNQVRYSCGNAATEELIEFCQAHNFKHFFLICDRNTQAVLGGGVEAALIEQGWDVLAVTLDGEEVTADEEYLAQALFHYDAVPRLYLAVGSGTITDIARFCSHRTGNPFAVLPTAPSVDGFASLIAPVVIRRFKDTAYCQPPVGIFADIQILCQAPLAMIAAGFGDMLGKYTALADWKLASLIWDEPYHQEIAARMHRALETCVQNVESIGQAQPAGIAALMDGLVESGLCMIMNGNSRPASGAEHHLSHYWEMKLLKQGRPAILHGAKVGVGTRYIARQYETLRNLTSTDLDRRLSSLDPLDWEREQWEVKAVFGEFFGRVAIEQSRYWNLTPAEFTHFKEYLSCHWSEILALAGEVPSSEVIRGLLNQVGAPEDVSALGLSSGDENEALNYAHYLRSGFTITKLGRMLKLW